MTFMARWLSVLWLITSCASVRTTGSFVERPASKVMQALAVDAAHQLGQLYPPARTQLAIEQTTEDAFGQPFVAELRRLGFAVAQTHVATDARGTSLRAAYAVDEVAQLYRVVLRIGAGQERVVLARAYTRRADTARAAGAWTQQRVSP